MWVSLVLAAFTKLSGLSTYTFTSTISSLSFSCNNPSDNVAYEIMAAFTLHLILYSLSENWKEPLKSSVKAKRCSNNWKNLNALRKKLAYANCWMGHEGVDTNWDLSPVSSTVSMLSHRGEFNKELETTQMRLIKKPTYLNGCAFGRGRISE